MRPLVLDASAALTHLRAEPGASDVTARLRERISAEAPLLVPQLFWLEVTNVLAMRYRYPPASVLEALYELEQLGLQTTDLGRPAVLAVLDTVARTGLTAYDAAYLALAEAADADLITADALLANAAAGRAIVVGPRRGGLAEERRLYRAAPAWPKWTGAGAYLSTLRQSVSGRPQAQ